MPFPDRLGIRRSARSTVWMAAHAFFAPNTSLTVSFYARSIDVEDRCTVSKFLNDWFPTRTRISVGFPPRVLVESEKGCPWPVSFVWRSYGIEEVCNVLLRCVFFILQCSSVGGDRNEAAGPVDDSATDQHVHKLVGYPSWKLSHHPSHEKNERSGKIDARKEYASCMRSPSLRSTWQRLAEMGCELCWVTAHIHAQPARMQHVRLGCCSCELADFLRPCVLFNFAGLAI